MTTKGNTRKRQSRIIAGALLCGFLVLLVSCSCSRIRDWTSFRGLKVGMTYAEVKSVFPGPFLLTTTPNSTFRLEGDPKEFSGKVVVFRQERPEVNFRALVQDGKMERFRGDAVESVLGTNRAEALRKNPYLSTVLHWQEFEVGLFDPMFRSDDGTDADYRQRFTGEVMIRRDDVMLPYVITLYLENGKLVRKYWCPDGIRAYPSDGT